MPWLLALCGIVATAIERGPWVSFLVTVLIVAGPIADHFRLLNMPRWLLAGIAVVLSFFTSLETFDRLALGVFVNILLYTTLREFRVIVGASCLMIVAGQSRASVSYLTVSLLFGAGLVVWLGLEHRRKMGLAGSQRAISGRDFLRVFVQLVIGLGVAGMSIVLVPGIENYVAEHSAGLDVVRSTGFGGVTNLNAVSELKSSSQLALRVFTREPQLLRGQTYLTYHDGVWRSGVPRTNTLLPDLPVPPGADSIESELSGSRRVFLPLGASLVSAGGVPLETDGAGVVNARADITRWFYRVAGRGRGQLKAEEAQKALEVPAELAAKIGPLVKEWTKGTSLPRERAGHILGALAARCTYSLAPGRPGKQEPIVRFLMETRKGHCEYFATSMIMALRLAGVPARFVAGYAVNQKSAFGPYWLAREGDAHAWVEAWLPPGEWRTFDPTPAGAGATGSTKLYRRLQELADAIFYHMSNLRETIEGWLQVPDGRWWWCVLVAVVLISKRRRLADYLLRFLKRRRKAPIAPYSAEPGPQKAHEVLVEWELLLAPLGLVRAPSCTPRELALRLEGAGYPRAFLEACHQLVDLHDRTFFRGDPWNAAVAAECLSKIAATLPAIPQTP